MSSSNIIQFKYLYYTNITSLISDTFNAPDISCLLHKTNRVAPDSFYYKCIILLVLIDCEAHTCNPLVSAYHYYLLPKLLHLFVQSSYASMNEWCSVLLYPIDLLYNWINSIYSLYVNVLIVKPRVGVISFTF
jgi:hypothetical protein